jgi:hypothetical protein
MLLRLDPLDKRSSCFNCWYPPPTHVIEHPRPRLFNAHKFRIISSPGTHTPSFYTLQHSYRENKRLTHDGPDPNGAKLIKRESQLPRFAR